MEKVPNSFEDNTECSAFCKSSGKLYPKIEEKKAIPTIWILIATLIVILFIIGAFFAFLNTDITLNVNSAFLLDNIIDKKPVNGKFLVLNVSVKNNGKDPLKVSADQLALKSRGNSIGKYSIFYGEGTDIQKEIEVPSGTSKDFLVVYDTENKTPDSVEYSGPFLWDPTYRVSANIKNLANTIPYDGMNLEYRRNMQITGSSSGAGDKKVELNMNVKTSYQKTDPPNKLKEISKISMTVNGEKYPENESTGIIDLKTFKNEYGVLSDNFLIKDPQKIGDSVNFGNVTYTLKSSEKIDFMSKKIDCWVLESNTQLDENSSQKVTRYYEKTTRLLIKMVSTGNVYIGGEPFSMSMNMELTGTNAPIIGVS